MPRAPGGENPARVGLGRLGASASLGSIAASLAGTPASEAGSYQTTPLTLPMSVSMNWPQ